MKKEGNPKIVKDLFYSLFNGIRKMRTRMAWIGFAVSLLISVLAYKLKPFSSIESMPLLIRYFFGVIVLMTPLWYLIGLGSAGGSREKFRENFISIGFVDKKGRTPFLRDQKKDGKKIIYTFYSQFPLSRWRKGKELLESQWNCTIVSLYEIDKQNVKITTIPGSLKIPEFVPWNNSYLRNNNRELVLGVDQIGPVIVNLDIEPHFIIAGAPNQGKSVALRLLIAQFVAQGAGIYMVDLKGGIEFNSRYKRFGEIATDHDGSIKIFDKVLKEIDARAVRLSETGTKNLTEYNTKTGSHMHRIGVFVDEAGQLLAKTGANKTKVDQIEDQLEHQARLSRAVGIHLFLGIQRPDAKIMDGQIKSNVTGRICGYFADPQASSIVLNNSDACNLPPHIKGRLLLKVGEDIRQYQGFYIDDDCLDGLVPSVLNTNIAITNDQTKQQLKQLKLVKSKITPSDIIAPEPDHMEVQLKKPKINFNYEEDDN